MAFSESPEGGFFFFMKFDAFSGCHPLTNFLFFLGAIGFSAVIRHPVYLLVSCAAAGCYYLLLYGRKGWKMLLGMLPLFLLVALTNPLFNTYGSTVLFTIFGKPYTLEALCYGAVIAGMLIAMLLWFGCYSAVLTSDKFVCLFGSLIPALSMLLVMVLRMIPSLTRTARQLSGARKSIGKGVGEQNTGREKLTGSLNILSALTDWALEGSIVTADSMRARGYGTAKRSSFQLYRLTARDWVLMVAMVLLAACVFRFGGTQAVFTPEISMDEPTWGLAAYAAFLLIPPILHAKEVCAWHISISGI